ncbi:GNAT family N-acetyltransferase [Streptomyces sp. NBC_01465]|uniref:GNAT family N-acetyltransferase n=1 Tax=Streptomyces sp. NBC_01465 TaxID=2903878 RepID=UPI002E322C25|nr:GNAT family N-acetyltransferase [Streptomyces sp. NBC_01465]
MTYVIEAARADDCVWLGPFLLRAWLQTYPNPESGIDEDWIREHRGPSATVEGVTRWREFIEAANRQPDRMFCRVVRSETENVGVICGRRDEVVTLGPMYLLSHAQGQGLGARMMTEFLAWAEPAPVSLWVTDYNESAVRFYQRHGFEVTGERTTWQGRLPNLRMTRDASAGVEHH